MYQVVGDRGPCLAHRYTGACNQGRVEERKQMMRDQRGEGFLRLWERRLQGGEDTSNVQQKVGTPSIFSLLPEGRWAGQEWRLEILMGLVSQTPSRIWPPAPSSSSC